MRDPGSVQALTVEGRGVQSLCGIGRMSKLEYLHLERVAPLDLADLRGVAATLQTLYITGMRGPFDGTAIASLVQLRLLSFDADDQEAAQQLARVDLSALTRLERLDLTMSGGRVPLELGAVASMPHLEDIKLLDFMVQEHDVPVLCRAPALVALSFTPATQAVGRQLEECLRGRLEQLANYDELRPNPLRRIHERTLLTAAVSSPSASIWPENGSSRPTSRPNLSFVRCSDARRPTSPAGSITTPKAQRSG